MSFSRDVRYEVAQFDPGKKCCYQAEMAAFLALRGSLQVAPEGGAELNFQVDTPFIARKIFKNCKALTLKPVLKLKKDLKRSKPRVSKLTVQLDGAQTQRIAEIQIVDAAGQPNQRFAKVLRKTCCQRSLLRTLFMCRGFVNNPENSYHLEMMIGMEAAARAVQDILADHEMEAKLSERKGKTFLYIKDSEVISDFLRLIGANQALLAYENIRIVKSVKNTVNRQVNCETANLSKIVNAATRQVELLEQLVAVVGWEYILPEYRELIRVRLGEKESSLQELGQMMDPVLSKSNVAYRMRKIEAYAREVLH